MTNIIISNEVTDYFQHIGYKPDTMQLAFTVIHSGLTFDEKEIMLLELMETYPDQWLRYEGMPYEGSLFGFLRLYMAHERIIRGYTARQILSDLEIHDRSFETGSQYNLGSGFWKMHREIQEMIKLMPNYPVPFLNGDIVYESIPAGNHIGQGPYIFLGSADDESRMITNNSFRDNALMFRHDSGLRMVSVLPWKLSRYKGPEDAIDDFEYNRLLSLTRIVRYKKEKTE